LDCYTLILRVSTALQSSEGRSSAVDCFTLAATPFRGAGAAAGAVFSHTPEIRLICGDLRFSGRPEWWDTIRYDRRD